MRCTLPASELLRSINTAATATPRMSDRPANTGVLLEVSDGSITATGTDGETSVSCTAEAGSTVRGEALLPPKPVTAYLATLPAEAQVTLVSLDTDEIEVTTPGRSSYRFRPIAATFTRPAGSRTEVRRYPNDMLTKAVRSIAHAVNREHGGVQLISSSTGIVLNATDNYRLAHAEIPCDGIGDLTVTVPSNLLELAVKLGADRAGVDARRTVIRFASDDVSITGRLLAVTLPPVETLLAAAGTSRVTVDCQDVRGALRPLEAVAGSRPLVVDIAGDMLLLSAANLEVGTGREQVPCENPQAAPAFQFAVSPAYLRDAVQAAEASGASRFDLHWTAPEAALHLKVAASPHLVCVIMPQTIPAG